MLICFKKNFLYNFINFALYEFERPQYRWKITARKTTIQEEDNSLLEQIIGKWDSVSCGI